MVFAVRQGEPCCQRQRNESCDGQSNDRNTAYARPSLHHTANATTVGAPVKRITPASITAAMTPSITPMPMP